MYESSSSLLGCQEDSGDGRNCEQGGETKPFTGKSERTNNQSDPHAFTPNHTERKMPAPNLLQEVT